MSDPVIDMLQDDLAAARAESRELWEVLTLIASGIGDEDEVALILKRPLPQLIRATLAAKDSEAKSRVSNVCPTAPEE